VAKTMILAALVLRRQLRLEQVARHGIAGVTRAELDKAARTGARIKLLASLEPSGDGLEARVEPVQLAADDPLAYVDGVANAVICRAEPVGEIMVVGPGAGPELAGQGVFSDLIAAATAIR
jgi:homoserine dehydrogenase